MNRFPRLHSVGVRGAIEVARRELGIEWRDRKGTQTEFPKLNSVGVKGAGIVARRELKVVSQTSRV